MWYLRKFPTIVDYETYKNNPDEFLVPSVSYVEEVPSCFYDPMSKSEPEVVLHPVIHAKFNATSENMTAIANTNQITKLKIDGNQIDFEPPVTSTIIVETLASEITINNDETGVYPSNYTQKYSSLTIRPADASLKCTDFDTIAILVEMKDWGQLALPLPINEAISYGFMTYDETKDVIYLANLAPLVGGDTCGGVFVTVDGASESYTPINTTCVFEATVGGLQSPYIFEIEGVHEVEIELTDYTINSMFANTCITDFSAQDITSIGTEAFRECISLTSINIPEGVTSIGSRAFLECESLTSVTIPEGVTEIGEHAFYNCESLTSIVIPDSVTSIGDYAFQYCESLASVTIPNSVTEIGDYAFHACDALTEITIPDSVTSIGERTFSGCSKLTSINIPDSVTSIGKSAFYYCDSLTSITIPNSVTEIGERAFEYCSGLASVTIPEGVTEIGGAAFKDCRSLTSITIPDSVTKIGNRAFGGCTSLTNFNGKFATEDNLALIADNKLIAFTPGSNTTTYTIPDGVTSIDEYVFSDCQSLTSITIPDSVTEIGASAFYYCRSLASIHCEATVPPTGANNMFVGNASNRNIYVPETSIDVYKSTEYWSIYADAIKVFSNKIYYTSYTGNVVTPYDTSVFGANIVSNTYEDGVGIITFDGLVTNIGKDAFFRSGFLTSITIPESVTEIGAAFYCSGLTSVTLPDGLQVIGQSAFSECKSLTSITIPESVTEIGGYAFYSCFALSTIYCKALTPPVDAAHVAGQWHAFTSIANEYHIYVPMESVEAYKSASGWSKYANCIEGYNF